jgi:hypothetical protein
MLSIYNYINLDIYKYIYVCILPVRILLVRGHPVLDRGLLARDRLVRNLLARGLPVLVRDLLVRGHPGLYVYICYLYMFIYRGLLARDRLVRSLYIYVICICLYTGVSWRGTD